MSKNTILAINPGSTSTKIAVFEGNTSLFVKNINHSNEQLAPFADIADQFDFRKQEILKTLSEQGVKLEDIDIIVGRGGLVRPLESGVYQVNEAMKADLRNSPIGTHASNLGGLIADNLASEIGGNVKAYIADPVVVDEMDDVARWTGIKEIKRISIFHALNQKAIARRYADQIGKKYEELNLIIAHLGGGISVGAHKQGRVIDVNNALDGEGAFTPERAGTLPAGDLLNLVFKKGYSEAQVRKLIKGEGGLVSLLGTNSAMELENRYKAGEQLAIDITNAMGYGIGKQVGAMATALHGKVDAIILTGGVAYFPQLVAYVKETTQFIAPNIVMPGEDEMSALAMNGLLVLEGKLTPKTY